MKHKFEYYILILIVKILKLFKEETRFNFAAKIGRIGYKLIKSRREVTLANLNLVFPEKTMKEKEKIAIKSYEIMAKAFLSSLWFREYFADEKNVKYIGIEEIEKLHKKGKAIAAAGIHMGNIEAPTKIADRIPTTIITKNQRNSLIDAYITENRKRKDLHIIKKSKRTPRELIGRIKAGDLISFFSDHRDKGADVIFFGRKTTAPTGASSFSTRYELPLILYYTILNDDNTSTVVLKEIHPPKTGDFKEDVQTTTQFILNEMEKVIREYPEQWMWFHDRWKIGKELKRKSKNK